MIILGYFSSLSKGIDVSKKQTLPHLRDRTEPLFQTTNQKSMENGMMLSNLTSEAVAEKNRLFDNDFKQSEIRNWAKRVIGFTPKQDQLSQLLELFQGMSTYEVRMVRFEVPGEKPGDKKIQENFLIKIPGDKVDSVNNYIQALEKTVLDYSNKHAEARKDADRLFKNWVFMTPWQLVKEAVRRLFSKTTV